MAEIIDNRDRALRRAKRPPHHPPDPGVYDPPTSTDKGFIKGAWAVAGFGGRDFYVAAIPAAMARELVTRHHYSHRVVNNSYVHLGVYFRRNLAGVLSFGYALQPARAGKVVEGTGTTEYLELNRMWLADVCPRNSESMAIAYSFRYIRQVMPWIGWVQSFADERCGRWGVVYQAANFLYVGSHKSQFLFLDCDYYHDLLVTAHRTSGGRSKVIREGLDRALRLTFRQFRYVFFLKPGWRKRLRLPVLPYPKPEDGQN
ncbi:hypothetical protein G3N56_11320 [Desulfovibrio sulfodismutans]|uniref:Uncharacterized protein n=1 Tax=Desulfolutivibrio sulfodismutans TaxID=63561 RepID=A0A7K3NMA5_9BACT|nr:hypothetical protein [Desulfolutivibrio sulfodismutans]NDY57332.1 hypothetical protein [Desulfolutivibrio sulfodismutans]QLA11873.1 hypothetical protein GD606_06165 [Desulfolutivibrio sulfodismutans DSM 3696]QLA13532.1 hypothetical protein GD606_15300 [Desulfolutivibrio sulfodismutans DSM 3696]